MSRGPGRIQRAIRQLFDANPDRAFIVEELVEHGYPDRGQTPENPAIEKKYTVAVLRAAHRVCARDPDWQSPEIATGRNVGIYFYNHDSVESTGLGILISMWVVYRWQRMRLERDGDYINSPDELRALLYSDRYRDLIEPGGTWWRFVEMHRAERDGDSARLARLKAEREAELAALDAGIRADLARAGVPADPAAPQAGQEAV